MYGVLQVSQKYGMHTLNMALYDLVMTKQITPERALLVANNSEEFQRMLGATGTASAMPSPSGARPLAQK
jgi:Tfp pilus assembly pilus retraction ATPase PilT